MNLTHVNTATYGIESVIISMLLMRKLRRREVNRLAQRHTVSGKDWKGAQAVWIKAPTQAASDPLAILFF